MMKKYKLFLIAIAFVVASWGGVSNTSDSSLPKQ